MSQFYVGQKVVCVRTVPGYHNSPIVGRPYEITGLYQSCSCGPCVTVGLMDDLKEFPYDRCDGCGEWCKTQTPEWEMCQTLFRPIDSLTEQMDRIEEEGAPVELEPEYA